MRMRKRKRRVIRLHGREMWEEKKTKRIDSKMILIKYGEFQNFIVIEEFG